LLYIHQWMLSSAGRRSVAVMKPTTSTSGTVTRHVFGRAYERGDRPALIDLRAGLVYGYRKLVTEITIAASGLVRQGVGRDAIVGVHVGTAFAQTLAVHTVIAAGAVAAPIDPVLGCGEIAGLLTGWGSATLITTPALAEVAMRAAGQADVERVITFGPVPGAFDFAGLGTLEPAALPSLDSATQPAMITATGLTLTHQDLLGRMAELETQAVLNASDVLLATWPPDGGCDLVALIDLAIGKGALVLAAHGLRSADLPSTVEDFGVTVVALPDGSIERV
jgi:acyl-CoA synthetase (AMP-forming)/AMP-acid ligase II